MYEKGPTAQLSQSVMLRVTFANMVVGVVPGIGRREGGGGGLVACLSFSTVDHASRLRRSSIGEGGGRYNEGLSAQGLQSVMFRATGFATKLGVVVPG